MLKPPRAAPSSMSMPARAQANGVAYIVAALPGRWLKFANFPGRRKGKRKKKWKGKEKNREKEGKEREKEKKEA